MTQPSRRQVLAGSASGLAVALAGCTGSLNEGLGAAEEGEFIVSTTYLRRPNESDTGPGTPADIIVRIDAENRQNERSTGTLTMTLRYAPDGDTEEEWSKSDDLEEPGGVSPQYTYVFEDAYQSGSDVPDDYEFEAEITIE